MDLLFTDFTLASVRSAKTVEEAICKTAAVLVVTMPAGRITILTKKFGPVAYYVKSLMDIKDACKRQILMSEKKNRPSLGYIQKYSC